MCLEFVTLKQGIAELEDLINFVRERYVVELSYADRLLDVSKLRPKAIPKASASSENLLESSTTGGISSMSQLLTTMKQVRKL
jgi:hypothetical protein